MKLVLKNNSSESYSYASGTVVVPVGSLDVNSKYWFSLLNDLAFINDIRLHNVIVNDGLRDYETEEAEAYVNRLVIYMTNRDSDGSNLQRTKITTTGWKAQFHVIRISTATTDGVRNKNKAGADLGLCTYVMYDNNGDVTVDPATAIRTVVTWEPKNDFEIVGGKLFQKAPPSTDVWMYVTAAAHIPAQYGGSVVFLEGGMNLADVGTGTTVDFDGKAPKYITYDTVYHSGRFEIELQHGAGVQHSFSLSFTIYRP